MYKDFVEIRQWDGSISKYGDINWLRSRYLEELRKVQLHLHTVNSGVNNSHIFCRLAGLMLSLYNDDLDVFLNEVYIQESGIHRLFGIVSSVNGKLNSNPPHLYTADSPTYFLGVSDVFVTSENWQLVRCVRVLSHPYSDTSFGLPNGKYNTVEKDTDATIISIDILKFAYKFWSWFKPRAEKPLESKDYVSFVSRWVLPDLLPSHMDIALFNRFSKMVVGAPTADWYSVYPVAMVNYNKKLDDMLEQYVGHLMRHQTISFERVLSTIPAMFTSTIRNAFHLEPMLVNDNNAWIIFLARINLYISIMTIIGQDRTGDNKGFVTNIRRLIISVEANQSVFGVLPDGTKAKISRLKFLVAS